MKLKSIQFTHVLIDLYTRPWYLSPPIQKSTHFKFKEMLKTAPSFCRISQSHPFCHLLTKPPHFTFSDPHMFLHPQNKYDTTYLTGLLKG